ncbi:MAG: hypothetical protein HFI24_03450 [Lachnospiraceae bacterium]|nr:hypothetical protein [Lachnospiraceae bacterium]MCI9621963.1 hypothetical protein [Lachnospiraceae bacterium]GFI10222.1 hypothetical protein IMSAGC007_02689 [Lachnospiraceae bacterium]
MEKRKITGKSILAAAFGVLLVGVGVAFNNCAGFGNDPVGIVYDGIRSISGMNQAQLGMASNAVNIVLLVFLFFVGRRYVSVGTFVYLLPYGFCVDLGNFLYGLHGASEDIWVRVVFSMLGCVLLSLGVAIYITVDIGVDPFTGVVLVLRDVLKKEYRYVKIGFDLTMVILGTLLGGRLGVVTVVTALAVGPVIQFFTRLLKKYFIKNNKC